VSGQRILIVEDAEATRQFLANEVLIPQGYNVKMAPDAESGRSVAQDWQPDLLISDHLLPGMNGLQLLEALKNDGLTMPFILMTAEGSESLAVQAMRLGVRDYLIKPFDIDYFLEAVERVLTESSASYSSDRAKPPNLASAALLETLLWNATDPILVTDEQRRLLFFNAQAQHTFQVEAGALYQPLESAIGQAEVVDFFQHQEPMADYEINLEGRFIFNAHMTSMRGIGRMAILQDITRLKELERTKSDLVTTISHDLRSPLTTILGYVELLERMGPLTPQQKKFTENILFSVRSITATLSDFMELSKIETGFNKSLEPTQVEIIAHYAIQTHRAQWEAKSQTFYEEIQPNLALVLGHPIRLKQMMANLLQNAIKYTPEGGQVGMRVYQENDFIIVQVMDSGIGISVEDQSRIFEKFFRAASVIETYPGTGLGLSIVKMIVEGHQGRIWVHSSPNEGTTFTVMLPIIQESMV
jgi:signal transduction histidine kinase